MDKDVKNVILITIDALRADHLPFMGYQRNTSPFLQEMAEKGTVFSLAFSNSSFTWASFPSLFSSDYPVLGNEYTIQGRTIIQEILQGKGYQTAAFNSNPYLSRYFKYDRGFDYFEDYFSGIRLRNENSPQNTTNMRRQIAKLIREHDIFFGIWDLLRKITGYNRYNVPYVNALTLTNDVLSWVKNQSREPFFLWAHYMDVHSPHVYPPVLNKIEGPSVNKHELKKRLRRINPAETMCANYLADLIDKYDSRIRYVDHAIENLFAHLEENHILDDCLVVITADHGEEFLDHGDFGHRPKLYDELIHVPLVIKGPNIPKGKKVDKVVHHLDIAPTILDLLNIPIPECFLGENIFKATERQGIISETSSEFNKVEINLSKLEVAYRTKDWKYIYSLEGESELYNVAKDPGEERNLISERKDKLEECESEVNRHILHLQARYRETNNEKKRIEDTIRALKKKGRL